MPRETGLSAPITLEPEDGFYNVANAGSGLTKAKLLAGLFVAGLIATIAAISSIDGVSSSDPENESTISNKEVSILSQSFSDPPCGCDSAFIAAMCTGFMTVTYYDMEDSQQMNVREVEVEPATLHQESFTATNKTRISFSCNGDPDGSGFAGTVELCGKHHYFTAPDISTEEVTFQFWLKSDNLVLPIEYNDLSFRTNLATSPPFNSSTSWVWDNSVDLSREFGFSFGTLPGTCAPTSTPTMSPSPWPSRAPTGSPSKWPTASPTGWPTPPTLPPTDSPTTASPTKSPTVKGETPGPSTSPTKAPSKSPSKAPTKAPSKSPTKAPSKSPTNAPTKSPIEPTPWPTKAPTPCPTIKRWTGSGFETIRKCE